MSYQPMSLCLCKVIPPKQWIKPDVQEETSKISLFQHEAAGTDILAILRHDEVDVTLFQVRERLDDTIRRYDREILQHQRFKSALFQKVGIEGFRRVHDKGVRAEMEEVG